MLNPVNKHLPMPQTDKNEAWFKNWNDKQHNRQKENIRIIKGGIRKTKEEMKAIRKKADFLAGILQYIDNRMMRDDALDWFFKIDLHSGKKIM